jgi:predicted Zn-dependent protease with MMP-like domain
MVALVAVALLVPADASAAVTGPLPSRVPAGRAVHCPSIPDPGRPTVGYRWFGPVPAIDVDGCRTILYGVFPLFDVPRGFFAGPGFRPGIPAYEYGTMVVTGVVSGQQVVIATNPSQRWRTAYSGFDRCTEQRSSSGALTTTCIALAVSAAPANLLFEVLPFVLVGLIVLVLVDAVRPAGPVRTRSRHRRQLGSLSRTVGGEHHVGQPAESIDAVRRRLRRLERTLAPDLSATQRHWFRTHLAAGRLDTALASLARWASADGRPLPTATREELEWLASSLSLEHVVLPILDRQPGVGVLPADDGDGEPGYLVGTDQFEALVAEALDSLPDALGMAMSNVVVTVEDRAEGRPLFGLYVGVPLTRRRHGAWNARPDRIFLYRKTICASCRTLDEVRAQVYVTVVHEVAHHFGISDPRLEELGWA